MAEILKLPLHLLVFVHYRQPTGKGFAGWNAFLMRLLGVCRVKSKVFSFKHTSRSQQTFSVI